MERAIRIGSGLIALASLGQAAAEEFWFTGVHDWINETYPIASTPEILGQNIKYISHFYPEEWVDTVEDVCSRESNMYARPVVWADPETGSGQIGFDWGDDTELLAAYQIYRLNCGVDAPTTGANQIEVYRPYVPYAYFVEHFDDEFLLHRTCPDGSDGSGPGDLAYHCENIRTYSYDAGLVAPSELCSTAANEFEQCTVGVAEEDILSVCAGAIATMDSACAGEEQYFTYNGPFQSGNWCQTDGTVGDATVVQPHIEYCNIQIDTDGDGEPDETDLDDDNDGYPDTEDAFPLDPFESVDSDGDGVGDNSDGLPSDPTEITDTDGDGIGDLADTDDDNDGVPDTEDAFPTDPTETTDLDGDGIGDNADPDGGTGTDNTTDPTADNGDEFPEDYARDETLKEINDALSGEGEFADAERQTVLDKLSEQEASVGTEVDGNLIPGHFSWFTWDIQTGECSGIAYDLGRYGSGIWDQHCGFYDQTLRPALEWLLYLSTIITIGFIWWDAIKES